jgi:hypothetical protein
VADTGRTYTGPCEVPIYAPGSICYGYTDLTATTINTTFLTVQPGSYYLGDVHEGKVVALARETIAVAGKVLVNVIGTTVADVGMLAAGTRQPSNAIWQTCPWDLIQAGAVDGITYWNDFYNAVQAANVAAAATTMDNGVVAFTGATAGSTVSSNADEPYGVAALNCTTDDETVCIAALSGRNTAGQIVFESGKQVWMEARVKIASIADDLIGMFCGFGEEGLCVTVGVIGANDALTDKDLIGFHKDAAAEAVLAVKHNTAGGGGITSLIATAAAMVADTYMKLGIYCDGTTVYFYVNGVVNATSVLLSAINFPDGEEMAFYYALTNKGGGDCVAEIDWVKIAQLR